MLEQHRPGIQLCLDRAGECERLAELAADPRSRQTYLRIARQWRSLAAHSEFVRQMENLLACSGKSKGGERDASPASAPD
jgi:hypothetical protein